MNSVFFLLLFVSTQLNGNYGNGIPHRRPPSNPYFGPPAVRRPDNGAPAALPKFNPIAAQNKYRMTEPQENPGLVNKNDILRCLKISLEFKGKDIDVAEGYMDVHECVNWCITVPKCLAVSYEFLLTKCSLKSDNSELFLHYGKESVKKSCVLTPEPDYQRPRGIALPQGWEPVDTVPPLPQTPPQQRNQPPGDPIRPPSYYTEAGGNYLNLMTDHPIPPALQLTTTHYPRPPARLLTTTDHPLPPAPLLTTTDHPRPPVPSQTTTEYPRPPSSPRPTTKLQPKTLLIQILMEMTKNLERKQFYASNKNLDDTARAHVALTILALAECTYVFHYLPIKCSSLAARFFIPPSKRDLHCYRFELEISALLTNFKLPCNILNILHDALENEGKIYIGPPATPEPWEMFKKHRSPPFVTSSVPHKPLSPSIVFYDSDKLKESDVDGVHNSACEDQEFYTEKLGCIPCTFPLEEGCFTPDVDCQVGDGRFYQGIATMTQHGTDCYPLVNQFCRNEGSSNDGVWCYTMDDLKLAMCPVPVCPKEDTYYCQSRLSYDVKYGGTYRGTESRTQYGESCQGWFDVDPEMTSPINLPAALAKGLGEHNFCRDPEDSGGVWCYTEDRRMESCTVPYCDSDGVFAF